MSDLKVSMPPASSTWQSAAASGLEEDPYFVTVYLSTYGAALASWLLVLGAVTAYCRLAAPRRVYGLNADSKVNFESFEQSMIVNLRVFGT